MAQPPPNRPQGTQVGAQRNQPAAQPSPGRDHSADLGVYGLPPDVASQVDRIFRRYPNDPAAAAQAAVAYIRGTPWYAQTYPGINQARQSGFIGTDLGSEREYKGYYLRYNALYKEYKGRDITTGEAAALFSAATDPQFLAQQFQGAAYIKTNRQDIQFLTGAFTNEGELGKAGLKAYGLQQAGYDNPLGQMIAARLATASAKVQRVFQGTLGSPDLQAGTSGLAAPQLAGSRPPGDVGA